MSKTCSTCVKELPMDAFVRNKGKKDGRANVCRDCNKEYQAKWRKDNPDRAEYEKKYYEERKDLYKGRKKEWRKNNPARETEARQKYCEKNRDKVNKYSNEWKANKRLTDPTVKIRENVSRRIRHELASGKTKSTCAYLGCSIDYLKIYLEARFSSWMNWDNYGKTWHIDHIIPCKSWDLTKEYDNYCCWNFRNLQPLHKISNISKKDKYDPIDKLFYETKMETILF